MSNLKHLSYNELIEARRQCVATINHYTNRNNTYADRRAAGLKVRLDWINRYLRKRRSEVVEAVYKRAHCNDANKMRIYAAYRESYGPKAWTVTRNAQTLHDAECAA